MVRECVEKEKIKALSVVYAYEFPEYKSVYIGRCLQYRLRKRHQEHRRGLFKEVYRTGDSVYTFANELDIELPNPIILEKELELIESCKKEEYYLELYKQEGWIIINKAKCGEKSGSIGSLSHGKWNYDSCYNEVLKYKTKRELLENNATVYNLSLRNKWMSDYIWLLDKNKEKEWTYDEVKKEAIKYKTKTEFSKKSNKAYNAAIRRKWIQTFDWFENGRKLSKLKYNFEECEKIAKKCKNRYEFQRNNKSAYERSWKEGWLKIWFGKERTKFGFYDIYENVYNVAKQYEYVGDFRKENETIYQKARKHKWLENFTWLKRKSNNQYTKNK